MINMTDCRDNNMIVTFYGINSKNKITGSYLDMIR